VERRGDLAEFLRVRRAAVAPADVGLPAGGRRRTAGLRREEVALLAGVSESWYTWLEQGRPIRVSGEVLDALARVLRLDPVERDHLHALAGRPYEQPFTTGVDEVPPHVAAVVARLDPSPAYALGPTWDLIAWNRAQAALSPQVPAAAPTERNLLWLVFVHPGVRALLGDWEGEARRMLSQFRAETTPRRDHPAVRALVERLRDASAEFAAWWPRHDVAGYEHRVRVFHHPSAGDLTFEHVQLVPAGHPELRIVAHLPVAGDDSTARLAAVS
jgi:transcriptional regulator with XRE-family HTH domain